ncbi:hypothetical protein ANNAL29_71 [Mycobacterium phage AnnaL29]|uniref:hypothetical protein n=1 Tax=Mycobacterium phage AnnaL29 TaxID=1076630 RepID=UPI00024DEB39|nr:hypothetical protein O153_gp36 [Mycobacterium phage AnnaL29]YP_009303526.1 hypothetical protein SEA_LOSER_73 [Mycobacterium phage Loser]AGS82752.1 hypothetical protein ANNAL29_71 [Mycobacterium phage AnnaL29]AMS00969.1 hypothetical protein SEA_LOSER_73 [Mycobacterium phage Loser]
MRNVQMEMNVAKQRRKLTQLCAEAPPSHQGYIEHLIRLFDRECEEGRPTPASQFIPMYQEEFGL